MTYLLSSLNKNKIINIVYWTKKKQMIAWNFLFQGPGYTKKPFDHQVPYTALTKIIMS